jgi:hypothetical protein
LQGRTCPKSSQESFNKAALFSNNLPAEALHEKIASASSLPKILSAESADAFQREGEDDAVLVSDPGVERHVLDVQAATIPSPAGARRQIDQHAFTPDVGIAGEKPVAQIVADGEAAIRSALRISREGGHVNLIAGKSRRIVAVLIFRIEEFIYLDAARVIPRLADLKDTL